MTPHNEQGRTITAFLYGLLVALGIAAMVGCQAYTRPDGSTGTTIDPAHVQAAQATAGTVGAAVAGAAQQIGTATGSGTLIDIGLGINELLTLLGIGGAVAGGAYAHSRGRHKGWEEKAKEGTAGA